MSFHTSEPGDHPWQSAKHEWELKVLPRLRRDGKAIGSAAYDGNRSAQQVLEAYHLLRVSFDPVALELLKAALRNYDSSSAADDISTKEK